MATKKKTAPEKTVSKTQYVKDLPATMPAKDVVAKGKADGVKLSVAYVYGIRAAAKKKNGAPSKRGRPFGAGSKGTSPKGAESALYSLIEAMVEQKVHQVLTARFGALLK